MPQRKQSVRQLADGFTLTELLITMAISGILLAAIVSTFITQQKAYALQTQLADMRLNTRAALDMVVREVRMAGYGVPSPLTAEWIDWVEDADGKSIAFTESIRIVPGGEESDMLSIVGCFDGLNRVADATGIRLDPESEARGASKIVQTLEFEALGAARA